MHGHLNVILTTVLVCIVSLKEK